VKGSKEILVTEDPDVANNPLIFPSDAVLAQSHVFRGLTEAEDSEPAPEPSSLEKIMSVRENQDGVAVLIAAAATITKAR